MGAYMSKCWTCLTVESDDVAFHNAIANDRRSHAEREAAMNAARKEIAARRAATIHRMQLASQITS
jgi:hypothetical protein